MKKIILIVAVSILSLVCLMQMVKASTHEVISTDVIEDGYIGNNFVRHNTETVAEISPPTAWDRRGYIEIQLPYISPRATILDYALIYCGEGYDISWISNIEGYSMEYKPSQSSDTQLYYDCKDGTKLFSIPKSCFIGGWHWLKWSLGDWLVDLKPLFHSLCINQDTWSIGMATDGKGWVMFSTEEQPTLKAYVWIKYSMTIDTPIPIAPVYGIWSNNNINTLSWTSSTGEIVSYICQYGTNPSSLDHEVETYDTSIITEYFPYNTTIYWRVMAKENCYEPKDSNWSSIMMYQIGDLQIPTPQLLTPENNEYFGSIHNQVTWSPVWGHSVYYVVDYHTSKGYSNNLQTTNTQINLVDLVYNEIVYWKVKAIENVDYGRESFYSSEFNFIIGVGAVPTPTLLSPTDGTFVSNPVNTLTWNSVSHPIPIKYKYEYGISLDHNGYTSSTSIETISYPFDTIIKWRIKAVEDMENGIEGQWSTTWQFTITNQTTLSPPELLSPDDGTSFIVESVPFSVSLSWKEVSGVNIKYNLSYKINGVEHLDQLTTTLKTIACSWNDIVEWKVQAWEDKIYGRTSLWSNSWDFTTEPVPLNPIVLITPPDNWVYSEPLVVVLQWSNISGNGIRYRLLLNDTLIDWTTHMYAIELDWNEKVNWSVQAYETLIPFRITEWSPTWCVSINTSYTPPPDESIYLEAPVINYPLYNATINYTLNTAINISWSSVVYDNYTIEYVYGYHFPEWAEDKWWSGRTSKTFANITENELMFPGQSVYWTVRAQLVDYSYVRSNQTWGLFHLFNGSLPPTNNTNPPNNDTTPPVNDTQPPEEPQNPPYHGGGNSGGDGSAPPVSPPSIPLEEEPVNSTEPIDNSSEYNNTKAEEKQDVVYYPPDEPIEITNDETNLDTSALKSTDNSVSHIDGTLILIAGVAVILIVAVFMFRREWKRRYK